MSFGRTPKEGRGEVKWQTGFPQGQHALDRGPSDSEVCTWGPRQLREEKARKETQEVPMTCFKIVPTTDPGINGDFPAFLDGKSANVKKLDFLLSGK